MLNPPYSYNKNGFFHFFVNSCSEDALLYYYYYYNYYVTIRGAVAKCFILQVKWNNIILMYTFDYKIKLLYYKLLNNKIKSEDQML
jgi:hypothetical protein